MAPRGGAGPRATNDGAHGAMPVLAGHGNLVRGIPIVKRLYTVRLEFYMLHPWVLCVGLGSLVLLLSSCGDAGPHSLGGDYYRQGNAIYCGERLLQADADSFVHVAWRYGKDQSAVYYCDVYGGHYFNQVPRTHVVKAFRSADPASFEVLVYKDKYTGYAKDAQHLYYQTDAFASQGAVRFVGDDLEPYAIVGAVVYFQGATVPADGAGYRHAGGIFFRDDQHFFAKGRVVYVDASVAEVLGREYIRDRRQVYFGHELIVDADPCSFVVSDERHVAFDERHYFHEARTASIYKDQYKTALAKWAEYYRRFKQNNDTQCPRKKIELPRDGSEIKIVDL